MPIIPTIDELDALIVAELQDDGRRSYKEIGERLGVSAGTVRARALQLMEDGVVDVIAIPNAWKMGFPIVAVVGLRVTPGKAEAVADILAEREEIAWVGLVATG
jgi:Lrp/AsnC family transcriptional regulator for asnA, asnC and gidA